MLRPFLICVLCLLTAGRGIADEKQVSVFLLIGQSNMEGHGRVSIEPQRNAGRGSLQWLADNRPDSPFSRLRDASGEWIERDDVWVHYLERHGRLKAGFGVQPDRMGPELGFGMVVGDSLSQPVLLVKLAWGGKSLGGDFRPPSAGSSAPGLTTRRCCSERSECWRIPVRRFRSCVDFVRNFWGLAGIRVGTIG